MCLFHLIYDFFVFLRLMFAWCSLVFVVRSRIFLPLFGYMFSFFCSQQIFFHAFRMRCRFYELLGMHNNQHNRNSHGRKKNLYFFKTKRSFTDFTMRQLRVYCLDFSRKFHNHKICVFLYLLKCFFPSLLFNVSLMNSRFIVFIRLN